MQNTTSYQQIDTEENENKPQTTEDLDDFIFCDEFVKQQSER